MYEALFIIGIIALIILTGYLFWISAPPSCFTFQPFTPEERAESGCDKCRFRGDCE